MAVIPPIAVISAVLLSVSVRSTACTNDAFCAADRPAIVCTISTNAERSSAASDAMPLPYAFLASADIPEPPPPPGGCVVIATGGGSGGCGAVAIVSAAVGDVGAEVVGWVGSVGAAVTTACAFAFAFAFAFSL